MTLPDIPKNQQTAPWVQSLTQIIQEQACLIQEQAEQIVKLKTTVQELRDEITKLKNTPKRPKFRPTNLNREKKKKTPNSSDNCTPPETSVQKVLEEITVKAVNVPKGSRFKGYATYSVQELVVTAKEITYRLEIWQAPDGELIKAELPTEIQGTHFGPDLRAMILGLYASGMTQPALFHFLSNLGIEISEGQIHKLLMSEAEGFSKQSEEILSAGLQEAPDIRVDDTGAKHCHQSGFCTHIGGQYFAYYKTTGSKSRDNFLKILAQGKEGYLVNDAFIWHLFSSGIEDDLLNVFEAYKGKYYRKKQGLNRLLNQLGIKNKKVRSICLEAGIVGFIQESQLKAGQVLISDRAGQFAILDHAGCWVHMERPLRKLAGSTPEIEAEIQEVRGAIWELYKQVKETSLTQIGKEQVYKAYDALIARQVTSPGVRKVLNSFRDSREEMLKALDHRGLPLHNNDSECDIRGMVKFRNVSGSTKSEEGRIFRDSLMTLKQTSYRLGESFLGYLSAWCRKSPIDLAEKIRSRYRARYT